MSNRSDEELLAALNQDPLRGLRHVGLRPIAKRFLDEIGAVRGDTFISCALIYWIYYKWCKLRKVKRMSRVRFFDGFKATFDEDMINTKKQLTRGYYISSPYLVLRDKEDERAMKWQLNREKLILKRKNALTEVRRVKALENKIKRLQGIALALKRITSQE